MALQISISNAIGARAVAGGGGVDPDAQAFITAAAITDPTQQAAINTLVVDLKGYNIWTKMKALYPMVGGTATSNSYNLKNTAQYQITWSGGVTHSSTGAKFGGVNGFGNTNLNGLSVLTQDSTHLSFYSRTQSNGTEVEIGAAAPANGSLIEIRTAGTTYFRVNSSASYLTYVDADSRAFYMANRTASNIVNGWRNSTKVATGTTASSSLYNFNLFLGALNENGNAIYYTTKECAFASIGDGLIDTEAANFYTAVQAFQTTLGRSIGTQTVSDADAQAFVTNAGIVDQVEANAINNLVIGLKADSLWTKMKAVYPFVGGTSTSHSYNLRNTAQYQINWNGGWTWNSNGVTGNGVNGWGNTGLIPNSALTLNSTHQSLYIRNTGNLGVDDFGSATNATTSLMRMIVKNSGTNDHIIDHYAVAQRITGTVADSTGFFVVSRENSTSLKSKRNDVSLGTNTNSNTGTLPTHALYLGALNNIGTAVNYTARNYAFASAGDGLSDTDMTNLRNRVVTFQTALNRNV